MNLYTIAILYTYPPCVVFVFVSVVVNTELFHRNCGLSVHENIHGSHSSIPRALEVAWEWSYGLGMESLEVMELWPGNGAMAWEWSYGLGMELWPGNGAMAWEWSHWKLWSYGLGMELWPGNGAMAWEWSYGLGMESLEVMELWPGNGAMAWEWSYGLGMEPLEVAWEWSYGLGMELGWAHPFSYGVQGTL